MLFAVCSTIALLAKYLVEGTRTRRSVGTSEVAPANRTIGNREYPHKNIQRESGRGSGEGGLGARFFLCWCHLSQKNTVHKEF